MSHAVEVSYVAEKKLPEQVRKHSAFVAMSNDVNVTQRKAWNCMLANAMPQMSEHDVHMIPMRVLLDAISMSSNNYEYLMDKIGELMKIQVRVNLLGKSKEKWEGRYQLLANVEYVGGMIFYSYGGLLQRRLHHPKVYAMLPVDQASYFGSKHTVALYELCEDYWKIGQTPFIDLETLREILVGKPENEDEAQASTYYRDSFKEFNRKVLKKAISHINSKTEFTVEMVFKQGARRSVTAVQFKIKRGDQLPLFNRSAPGDERRKATPNRIAPPPMDANPEDANDIETWFNNMGAQERKDLWVKLTQQVMQVDPTLSGNVLEMQIWRAMIVHRRAISVKEQHKLAL